MSKKRPFDPNAIRPFAAPWLSPNVGNWSSVWRYTILVPTEHLLADGTRKLIATDDDLFLLEQLLIEHFGGITILSSRRGVGARDPRNPLETREMNVHTPFQVYAPATSLSDQYFQALRFELQEALVEGQVLVEREDVLLL